MSNLFSRLYDGTIKVFNAAEAEWDAVVAKVKSIPGVNDIEAGAEASVKQEISNALAFVDTEWAPHFGEAVSMVESAIDTGLVAFGVTLGPTGEIVVKAVTPAVNAGATLFFNQLRGLIDQAEAEFKANANLPPPTSSAEPSLAGVIAAVAGPNG